MRRYEITDQQWDRIAHLLPGREGHVGQSAKDNRLFINAVLWAARSGAPWRDLPERFGPAPAARLEFSLSTLSTLGQIRCVATCLRGFTRTRLGLVDDRFYHRACPPACRWSKKGDPASECLGQSVGGWTTARRPGKIHAVIDGLGNPLRIIMSVGHQADIKQAEALLTGFQTDAVIADRGYDADSLLTWLADAQVEAVIPAKRNRLIKRSIDKNLYKDRNKRGRPSGGALF